MFILLLARIGIWFLCKSSVKQIRHKVHWQQRVAAGGTLAVLIKLHFHQFPSTIKCIFKFNLPPLSDLRHTISSNDIANWIEIESAASILHRYHFLRLYPHRWTMKIHFYFIPLWNMLYNIFARRNKNIQSRRMGGCGSRKESNGKKFNNNVSDIWKIHTGVGERTWRAEKKRKRKLWWWYPERISNKTTYTMSPRRHEYSWRRKELSRREVQPW